MNPELINQESLKNRFVGFIEPYPSWKYRVAKVIEIEKKKRFPIGQKRYKTKPAVKVIFNVTKVKKLIPLESIVSVFLKKGNNGIRREIPIETWVEDKSP